MSILDALLSVVIWLVQNTLIGVLPSEFSGLPINTFANNLNSISSNFINSFGFINAFVDLKYLFLCISIVVTAEILLHFGFKGIKYIINLVRGSGA